MNTMDNGCRPIGIYARYRELASGVEKVACFWELDQVFCSLRPQYEDGVIEILQIATECDVVILTDSGFSNILELDDSKVKGWCGAIIDACRRNLVMASARGSGGSKCCDTLCGFADQYAAGGRGCAGADAEQGIEGGIAVRRRLKRNTNSSR
jgi:hypothetical protein